MENRKFSVHHFDAKGEERIYDRLTGEEILIEGEIVKIIKDGEIVFAAHLKNCMVFNLGKVK